MKKLINFVNRKIVIKTSLLILILLLIVFVAIGFFTRINLRNEVLEQWRALESESVRLYSEMIDVNNPQKIVDKAAKDKNLAYALFINSDMEAVAHSNPDRIGIILDDEGSIAAVQRGVSYSDYFHWSVTDSLVLDVLHPVYENGEVVGAFNIGINVDVDTMNEILSDSISRLILLFIVSIIVLISSLIIILKFNIINPIYNIKEVISKQKDLDFKFDKELKAFKYMERKDEIGQLINMIYETECSVAEFIKEVSSELKNITDSSEELSSISSESSKASEEVAKSSEEIAEGATNQSKDTAEGIEAIEKLIHLLDLDGEQVSKMGDLAEKASSVQSEGLQLIKDLLSVTQKSDEYSKMILDAISNTDESAKEINEKSRLLKDIADQTNLLALNATIEAARAGEAGRGFAVVAEEIRKLAEQSNRSISEINEVIESLQKRSAGTLSAMENAKEIISNQSNIIKDTAQKFDDMSDIIDDYIDIKKFFDSSADDMNEQTSLIVELMQNLSAVSEENAAATEEVSASIQEQLAASEEISSYSEKLSNIVKHLNNYINKFKY